MSLLDRLRRPVSLDSARHCPVHNVYTAQVARGLRLSLLEVRVRHANVIQQLELVGASRRQLALLLADDPVAKGMDSQISRPVLQQPFALCSLVLARSLLDDPFRRLVLLERIPLGYCFLACVKSTALSW